MWQHFLGQAPAAQRVTRQPPALINARLGSPLLPAVVWPSAKACWGKPDLVGWVSADPN